MGIGVEGGEELLLGCLDHDHPAMHAHHDTRSSRSSCSQHAVHFLRGVRVDKRDAAGGNLDLANRPTTYVHFFTHDSLLQLDIAP